MKNLRYYIIFGITFILLMIIIFYKEEHLGVYEDSITIFYETEVEEGYAWDYSLSDDSILKFDSYNKEEKEELVREEWKFVPNANGKVQLVFEYKNEDGDYLYKIIYDLKIRGNKIYWLYGEGKGLVSYPNPY